MEMACLPDHTYGMAVCKILEPVPKYLELTTAHVSVTDSDDYAKSLTVTIMPKPFKRPRQTSPGTILVSGFNSPDENQPKQLITYIHMN